MLRLLDVVWVYDNFIRPPDSKMWVCVEPNLGLYFRINSAPKWQIPVAIGKADNPFLDHDSYLECGSPLEVDDYFINQALAKRGVIGRLNHNAIPSILAAIRKSSLVRDKDRDAISQALTNLAGSP